MPLPVHTPAARLAAGNEARYKARPQGGKAGLAQLVEHLICNQGVAGSNPAAGTSKLSRFDALSVSSFTRGAILVRLTPEVALIKQRFKEAKAHAEEQS